MELPGGESVALQSGTAVMAAPQGAWLYTATTPGVLWGCVWGCYTE